MDTRRHHQTTFPSGWVVFAGMMVVLAGMFDALYGLTAILNNHVLTVSSGGIVSVWDLTTWGWIHLVAGALLVLTGFALWSGSTWSRWAVLLLAGLNAVGQVAIITVTPWWSFTVIVLDLLVIYAVAARWEPEY